MVDAEGGGGVELVEERAEFGGAANGVEVGVDEQALPLDGVGGAAYLMKLNRDVPTTANVQAYIDIVLEKSILRRLIEACRKISRESYTQEKPVKEVLSLAEKMIGDRAKN